MWGDDPPPPEPIEEPGEEIKAYVEVVATERLVTITLPDEVPPKLLEYMFRCVPSPAAQHADDGSAGRLRYRAAVLGRPADPPRRCFEEDSVATVVRGIAKRFSPHIWSWDYILSR